MSRAALLFVGATVTAGCGGQTEASPFPPGDGGRDAAGRDAAASDGGGDDTDAAPVPAYGPGPIWDSGPREASPDAPTDAPTDAPSDASDAGGLPVMYGPAPVDAG
jgi:hypothetical protein